MATHNRRPLPNWVIGTLEQQAACYQRARGFIESAFTQLRDGDRLMVAIELRQAEREIEQAHQLTCAARRQKGEQP